LADSSGWFFFLSGAKLENYSIPCHEVFWLFTELIMNQIEFFLKIIDFFVSQMTTFRHVRYKVNINPELLIKI
jgi:hypothetical protein